MEDRKTTRKYKPIEEDRGWYFVEYRPPVSDSPLATLNLVITVENALEKNVVPAMEKELKYWLNRYPVPLFISSWDNKGDRYKLKSKSANYLTGFIDEQGKLCMFWGPVKGREIPNVTQNKEYLDNLYTDLDYKTYAELDAESQRRRKGIKTGSFIFFVWLILVPVFIEVVEYYSNWLSFIALLYSFYKAIQTGLELKGKWPKSKRQKEKEEEERLKDQYYYHCQMNLEGFRRLKLENMEKMAKEGIAEQAEALKKDKH